MNKSLKYILLLVLLSTSCTDWLTLKPQDKIVGEDFWKTKEDVHAAVVGCYASLLDADLTEQLFLWGELRADMITPTTATPKEDVEIFNGNIQDLNPIVNWGKVYKSINYCNSVIKLAPDVAKIDGTLTDQILNQYLSEALAIRALLYFYLVRSFGEVPLKLEPTTSDDSEIDLPKSTADQILNNIINDLAIAEQSAVESYGQRASDKGRVTKYMINALQADVYLWMEQYENCITACNKIISSKKYGLIGGDGANIFQQLYLLGNSNESIFEIQFDAQKLNQLCTITDKELTGSSDLSVKVFGLDLNNVTNRDYRGVGLSIKEDGAIWKYAGTEDLNSNLRRYSSNNIVYRYADVLLMRAEAENQLGFAEDALLIVNIIRSRSNALAVTKKSLDASSNKEEIADYILEERAREFAFEGKRWYDVLRNAKRNDYARLDLLINMAINNAPPERQQSIIAKLKDTNSHYFPIYQFEVIRSNGKLDQNPFYKR